MEARAIGQFERPTLGTRNAFSQAYVRDFHTVWDEAGIAAIRTMAKKNPSGFVAVASKLIPNDVRVAVEASPPGNLSPRDWADLRELLSAVRTCPMQLLEAVEAWVEDVKANREQLHTLGDLTIISVPAI